jgi:signal transduction histidine kinase
MRSILRALPIRWQIPALYAVILALVLAAGGVALWNTQRKFQYDALVAKQVTELRALIPSEFDPKLDAMLYEPSDPAALEARYVSIVDVLLPPGSDSAVALKKIALLDPALADKVFPPGANLPPPDEMRQILIKAVSAMFPPGEDLQDMRKKLLSIDPTLPADRWPAPALNQRVFKAYAAELAQKISTKERGITIFSIDKSILAQDSGGADCLLQPVPAPKGGPVPVIDKSNAVYFDQLRKSTYLGSVSQGQLTVELPLLWRQDRPLALAQVCVSTDDIDAELNQLALSLVVGWALVVGLATLLGVTATRRVLRPLDRVIATTNQIAAGDLHQRVGLPPGDTEIAQLGAAFDAMIERLEAAFATQRRFVADAAHELRTPLTALSASVELLLMGAADQDPGTARRLLRHLDSELSRVIRLTNDLLTLSRLDARPLLDPRPLDLSALLEEVGEQSRTLLNGQALLIDIAPGLGVQGDPDRLRQVVLNLLDNARKYTPSGGRIVLRAYADDRGPTTDHPFDTAVPERVEGQGRRPPTTEDRGLKIEDSTVSAGDSRFSILDPRSSYNRSVVGRWSSVVVEVQDNGVGIASEALPHLFERFYRVDNARARASGGSGLGLAIVHAIVEAHDGQVAIQSAPGEGTCVAIQLPRSPMLTRRPAGAQDHVASAPLLGPAE